MSNLDLLTKLGAVSVGSLIATKGATILHTLRGKAITLLLVSLSLMDGNDGDMTVDMTGDGGTLFPDLTL